MKFIIRVACSELVKKHVQNTLSKEVLPIEEHNKYGQFLRMCLIHPSEASKKWDASILDGYKEELCCDIGYRLRKYKTIVVDPERQVDFNEFVKMDIKNQLHRHIDLCIKLGMTIRNAIEIFWEQYNLSPTLLPYDGCVKSYYRYRNP